MISIYFKVIRARDVRIPRLNNSGQEYLLADSYHYLNTIRPKKSLASAFQTDPTITLAFVFALKHTLHREISLLKYHLFIIV